jgi:ammonium transporter, Amt family
LLWHGCPSLVAMTPAAVSLGISAVGALAAIVTAAAILVLVRSILLGRMVWAAVGATGVTIVVTVVAGALLGAAPVSFLLGISVFALPVLVLIETAAVASGADRFARWLLMLVWGVGVFPVVALAPLVATRNCLSPDCRFEDFGGGLPLVISAAAFVVLAWLPAGVHEHPAAMDARAGRRAVVAIAVVWVSFGVWLAHLEGTFDAYVPRILLAALIGPASAAVGWLIVDRLREVTRPVTRSLGLGLVTGVAATLPGAVSVGLPWGPLVGALAGAVAALVFSTAGASSAGLATRWGLALLVATAVGFLAPPVSGEAAGILFTARWSSLTVPLLVFAGTVLWSVLVSAPVWVLVRRHAARERIPAEILE